MPDIVGGYTYLTGRTPLPQLWTLGYHQSRWGYDSADCIKKVAGKYRELDIPCDTMHFDIDYMDGYRSLHGMRKITAIRQEPFRSWQMMDSRQSALRSGCEIRSGL